MPLAYVTEPGAVVRREGETLTIHKDGTELAVWPLLHVDGLVVFGGVQLTTPAMTLLLSRAIPTAFVTQTGRFLGSLVAPLRGSVPLRLAQYQLYHDRPLRLQEAARLVRRKIVAQQDVLERYAENYPEQPLRGFKQRLKEFEPRLERVQSITELLGVEGAAAAVYWQALPLCHRSDLPFRGRSRRPPADPVNALLSLGYTFLVNELSATLETAGLDPYVGVYHTAQAGRPALALDLMEPFRHQLIDRLVLRAVNLGKFKAESFETSEEDGFRLKPDAFRTFIAEYERMLLSTTTDPLDGSQRSWRDMLRQGVTQWRELLRTVIAGTSEPEMEQGWEQEDDFAAVTAAPAVPAAASPPPVSIPAPWQVVP